MSDYTWYKSNRKRGTKLLRPMGFEFTFERKGRPNNYRYRQVMKKLELLGYSCEEDCGCLEVQSPVFKYLEDVITYYKRLREIIGPKYVSKNPRSTGGGCHIHIGLSYSLGQINKKFRKRLAQVVWNRPWLTWAYQDPSDDDSSEPICTNGPNLLRYNDDSDISGWNSELGVVSGWVNFGDKCCTGTSILFKGTTNTLELRFFDNPSSLSELKYNILTANYLVGLALSKKAEMKPVLYNFESMYKMLVSGDGLKEFRRFKKESGIKYTESKIRQRMEWEEPPVGDWT